jgi:hypothetical protein
MNQITLQIKKSKSKKISVSEKEWEKTNGFPFSEIITYNKHFADIERLFLSGQELADYKASVLAEN